MAYTGLSITLPLGKGGLLTDDTPSAIPPTALIDAQNIRIFRSAVEKDGGSVAFTMTGVPEITGGIMGAIEFSYDLSAANRIIVMVGGDGYVYYRAASGTATKIAHKANGSTAARRLWNAGAGTPHNQVCLVIGGSEVAGNDRKLFIFTGQDPVQVLVWSASHSEYVMSDISAPAADWSSNYPTGGCVVGARLAAWGNANLPNEVYGSTVDNHEDFVGGTGRNIVLTSCYPGVGERIVHGAVFKGLLIVFKNPFGIVGVDVTTDANAWSPALLSSTVGAASQHCGVQALDDYLFKNSTGSISSLVATNAFGDFTAGDILVNLRIEEYIRNMTTAAGNDSCHALYYGEKKHVYFGYRSVTATSTVVQDLLLSFYMGAAQDTRSKAAGYYSASSESMLAGVITKDSTLSCMFKYRDANGIERPAYGSNHGGVGKIYRMDQTIVSVDGNPYLGMFQTPHLDFGFADPKLMSLNKNFDFLEFRYESQGDYPLFAETYIDGTYYQTVRVDMSAENVLADDTFDPLDFMLDDNNDSDSSTLADDFMRSIRVPIAGMGKTISVRVYNTGNNQGFKISSIVFSFKVSGQQQTKG